MIVAAIRTFLACLVVSVYVLVCGPPVLLWTLVTRNLWLIYRAGAAGIVAGFSLAGIRLDVRGLEHLTPAAVYACNHSSNVEPPAVFLALRALYPRLRVLYKAEMRKLPVLVWVFDVGGFVPVERSNKGQSWPALDRAADGLRTGASFVVFPEGTRSRTGDLLPFKKGGFVMAIKAQAPVVPVAVSGGRAAMRKGSPLIWPTTIVVELLPPVLTEGLDFDDRGVLVERVRGAIHGCLHGAALRRDSC